MAERERGTDRGDRVGWVIGGRDYVLDCDGSSGNSELEERIAAKLVQVHETFKKKQASYGPGNIAEFGERGVFIRMNDKMKRLKRLVWDGEPNPLDDETIEDTFIDIADYAVIALVVRDGGWPTLEYEHRCTECGKQIDDD